MYFPIPGPDDQPVYPIRNDGSEGRWRMGKKEMLDIVQRGDALFEKRENGTYVVYEKIRKDGPRLKPFRTWMTEVGQQAEGTETLKRLFDGIAPFPYPKPLSLLRHLLQIGTAKDGIVLDFFAGSGTTGQAVIDQNIADDGTRKFILVQLPEPVTDPESEAAKLGFTNIADVTKERVRRAIRQTTETDGLKLTTTDQLGFKVFRLTSSNFKVWDDTISPTAVAEQLSLMVENIVEGRSDLDLLYEILLKSGHALTTPFEAIPVAMPSTFSVDSGALIICLAKELTLETIRLLVARKPHRIICLDQAFHGNDTLKVNARLELENQAIQFQTV